MLIIMRIMIDHQPMWLWTTIKCGILKIKSINHNNNKNAKLPNFAQCAQHDKLS